MHYTWSHLRIWSHLLKKSLLENLIFLCSVVVKTLIITLCGGTAMKSWGQLAGGDFMQSWEKLTKGKGGSILTKNWWTSLNCLLKLIDFLTILFQVKLPCYFTRILRNFANFSENHQNLCIRLSYQFRNSYRTKDYQNRVSEKYCCN